MEPESIDEAILPRTFRDAVILTRELGKEYLLIDSLCILQKKDEDGNPESKADWEKESKLMCRPSAPPTSLLRLAVQTIGSMGFSNYKRRASTSP